MVRKATQNDKPSSKPVPLTVKADGIPPIIKRCRNLLVWKYVWEPPEGSKPGKWAKHQYSPKTGRKKGWNKPPNWGTFEEACQALAKGCYDGISFAFPCPHPDEPDLILVGIDLDKCLNATGEITSPDAHAVVRMIDSAVSLSPSGTGLRVLCWARSTGKYVEQGWLGVKSESGCVTLTGHLLEGTPAEIKCRAEQVEALMAKHFPPEPAPKMPPRCQSETSEGEIPDSDLLRRMFGNESVGQEIRELWEGGMQPNQTHSDSGMSLICHLVWWSNHRLAQVERMFRASKQFELHRYVDNALQAAIAKADAKVSGGYDPTFIPPGGSRASRRATGRVLHTPPGACRRVNHRGVCCRGRTKRRAWKTPRGRTLLPLLSQTATEAREGCQQPTPPVIYLRGDRARARRAGTTAATGRPARSNRSRRALAGLLRPSSGATRISSGPRSLLGAEFHVVTGYPDVGKTSWLAAAVARAQRPMIFPGYGPRLKASCLLTSRPAGLLWTTSSSWMSLGGSSAMTRRRLSGSARNTERT